MTKELATKESFVDGDSGRHAPLAMEAATFRKLGHRLVDQVAGFLESLPLGPVTRYESPSSVRDALDLTGPLPELGTDPAALLERTAQFLFAHSLFNGHPRLSGSNSKVVALRGYMLSKLGRTNEAREVLNTFEAISRERYVPPYAMALVHAGLGQRDPALECLERAYEARDVHLIFLTVDPKWDAFRSDVRFLALLRRCGFTQPGSSTH